MNADFGFQASNTPRLTELALGGGALLDIGCYVISFASMIFGGAVPSRVTATSEFMPTGADLTTCIQLSTSNK